MDEQALLGGAAATEAEDAASAQPASRQVGAIEEEEEGMGGACWSANDVGDPSPAFCCCCCCCCPRWLVAVVADCCCCSCCWERRVGRVDSQSESVGIAATVGCTRFTMTLPTRFVVNVVW